MLLLGNSAGSYNARNDADSNAGNAYGMVVWECQYGNYAGNKNVSSNNVAGNPVSKKPFPNDDAPATGFALGAFESATRFATIE